MKILKLIPLTALLVLARLQQGRDSCRHERHMPGAKPVATVNGTPISRADVRLLREEHGRQATAELTPDQRNQLLDNLIAAKWSRRRP